MSLAPLPVHNLNGSLASLARTVLSSVDRRRLETPVQTESLVLLLTKFIELAEPKQSEDVGTKADKSVRQLLAQVETAIKDRDEDAYQAKGGESPKRKAWS